MAESFSNFFAVYNEEVPRDSSGNLLLPIEEVDTENPDPTAEASFFEDEADDTPPATPFHDWFDSPEGPSPVVSNVEDVTEAEFSEDETQFFDEPVYALPPTWAADFDDAMAHHVNIFNVKPRKPLGDITNRESYGLYIPSESAEKRRHELYNQGFADVTDKSCVVGAFEQLCKAARLDPWKVSHGQFAKRCRDFLATGGNAGREASSNLPFQFTDDTHTSTELFCMLVARGVSAVAYGMRAGFWGTATRGLPCLIGNPKGNFLGYLVFIDDHVYYKPRVESLPCGQWLPAKLSKAMSTALGKCSSPVEGRNFVAPPEPVAERDVQHIAPLDFNDIRLAETASSVVALGQVFGILHANLLPATFEAAASFEPAATDSLAAAFGLVDNNNAPVEEPVAPPAAQLCDFCGEAAIEFRCAEHGCARPNLCGGCHSLWHNHPDRKTHRVTPLVPMEEVTCMRSELGVSIVDDSEPSESGSFTGMLTCDLLDRIIASISGISPGLVDVAILSGPLAAIGVSVYNLVECALTGKVSWHKLGISLTGLVAGIVSACAIVAKSVVTVEDSLGASIRRIIARVVLGYISGDQSAAASWCDLPCKLLAIAVAAIGSVIAGRNFVASMNAFNTGYRCGDAVANMTISVAKLLGFDVDGSKEFDVECQVMTSRLENWLAKPVSEWVGDNLVAIKSLSHECASFSAKVKRANVTDATTQYSRKLTDFDKRLSDVICDLSSRKSRPPPVCIYLYSKQGGIGKTNFASWLPKALSKRVKGFNDKTFTNFVESKHVCAYHGEHTFFMDEVGAAACSSFEGAHPYLILNGLVGTAPYPLPAANLEAKNQVPKPLLVIIASNLPYAMTASPLTIEAKDAQRTRIIEIHVVDKSYDPSRGRECQPHRKPDFSHLTFEVREFVNKEAITMNCEQLVDVIGKRIVSNVVGFRQREVAVVPDRGFLTNGIEEVDVSAGTEDKKFCFWVCGEPGTRKSTDCVATFQGVSAALGWGFYKSATLDVPESVLNCATPTIVVLDDLFEPTQECEYRFMDLYNKAGKNTIFLVVSNHGPVVRATSPLKWLRSAYKHYSYSVPGFARRFGFDPHSQEAVVCVKTLSDFCYLDDGMNVTAESLCANLKNYVLSAAYVNILPVLPQPLPFNAGEADIFLVAPKVNNTMEAIKLLKRGASARACAWMLTESLRTAVNTSDISATIKSLFQKVSHTVSDAKIYVCIDGYVYYLNGRDAFLGVVPSRYGFVVHNDRVYLRDPEGNITRSVTSDDVARVYAYDGTFSTMPSIDTDLFIHLLQQRDMQTDFWYMLLRRYPVPSSAHQMSFERRFRAKWEQITANLPSGKVIAAIVAAGAAIAGIVYFVYSRQRNQRNCKRDELLAHVDMNVVLTRRADCAFCDNGLEHMCPAVSNSAAVSAGGNRGKNKFGMKVTKGGVNTHRRELTCSEQDRKDREDREDDERFDDILERVFGEEYGPRAEAALHDAMHDMESQGMLRNRGVVRGRYQGIPMVGRYAWTGGKLERSWELDYDSDSSAAYNDRGFEENVVDIENIATGSVAYGMLYNDSIVRVGTHMLHNSGDRTLSIMGGRYHARAIYEVPGTDITFCEVTDTAGKPAKIPGIKSIVNRLVSLSALKSIKKVAIVVAGTTTKLVTDWVFEETMTRPIRTYDQRIFRHAATVVLGSADTHGLVAGKCGSQLLWQDGKTSHYLGMFASIRSGGHYVFTVATVEEWNDFITNRSKSAAADAVNFEDRFFERADYVLPEGWKRTAYFPYQVAKHFVVDEERQPTYKPHGPGLEFLKHVPDDKFAIDPPCEKVPVLGHAFEPVFGNLKAPVLSLEEIEAGFPEKLTPDVNGNRRAFSVRLVAADANVPLGIRNSEVHRDLRLRAEKLGAFYSEVMGKPSIAPWSKKDAIWGNGTYIEPLKKATSVGSAFKLMFPNLVDKGSIFERGQEGYIGTAGLFTERWIDQQYSCWKDGKMLFFPSSIATKGECLPVEKVWKKRLINIVDPVTVVNQKRLLGPVQKAFSTLGTSSPFQIAMDPLRDFSKIADGLSKHPNMADLDVSSFDLSCKAELLSAAGSFCSGVYQASATLDTMLQTCMESVAFTPFLMEQKLIRKSGGVTSGMWGTSFTDSVIMHLVVYEYACHVLDGWVSPSMFLEHVQCIHGGDDTVVSWSDVIRDHGFTAEGLCAFAKEKFHLEITPPNKVLGQESVTKDLLEVSFCSRRFTTIPGMTYVSGRLKPEAMSSALCWTTPEGLTCIERMLEELQVEFACWPDEYYHRFCEIVTKLGLAVRLRGLASIRSELRDQIVESRSAQKLKLEKEVISFSMTTQKSTALPYMSCTLPNTSFLDISTVSRRFREALLNANEPSCIVGSAAWAAMGVIYPVAGFRQECVYKGVTYDYSQDWSPAFFSEVYGAIATGVVPKWVLLAAPLVITGDTKEDRKMLWRKRLAQAIVELLSNASDMLKSCYAERGNFQPENCTADVSAGKTDETVRNARKRYEQAEEALRCARDRTTTLRLEEQGALRRMREAERAASLAAEQLTKCTQLHKQAELAIAEASKAAYRLQIDSDQAYAAFLHAQERDDRPCSGMPTAGSTSGEPPTVKAGAGPSITSAGGGGELVGVTANPMPATAAATTEPVVPLMGMAQAVPMQQITGGPDGTEIVTTAYGHNVLTLASIPIFKKIITVPTSVSEGTVLLVEDVSPWNEAVMNPYAFQWADLHARFTGSLICNLQFITATTVIGAIKAYFVPALFVESVKLNQQWLDAMGTQLELTLNSAGVATIELKPTFGMDMKTGVYRDHGAFGQLVIITSSNIRNTYKDTTQVDIKLSFCLGPGSYFDLPATAMGYEVGYSNAGFDIPLSGRRLVIDGDYTDNVDYAATWETSNYTVFTEHDAHQSMLAVPIDNFNLAAFAGQVFKPITDTGSVSWAYSACADGTGFNGTGSAVTSWGTGWQKDAIDTFTSASVLGYNFVWKKTNSTSVFGFGGSRVQVGSSLYILADVNPRDIVFHCTGKLCYDYARKGYVSGYRQYCRSLISNFQALSNAAVNSTMRTDGQLWYVNYGGTVPFVATASQNDGVGLTGNLRRASILRTDDVVPLVSNGLRGITVPPSFEDGYNLRTLFSDGNVAHDSCVVTKLKSKAGVAICEILRNRFGCFVRMPDNFRYSTVVNDLGQYHQEHRVENVHWPGTVESNTTSFAPRAAVSGARYTTASGTFEWCPRSKELDFIADCADKYDQSAAALAVVGRAAVGRSLPMLARSRSVTSFRSLQLRNNRMNTLSSLRSRQSRGFSNTTSSYSGGGSTTSFGSSATQSAASVPQKSAKREWVDFGKEVALTAAGSGGGGGGGLSQLITGPVNHLLKRGEMAFEAELQGRLQPKLIKARGDVELQLQAGQHAHQRAMAGIGYAQSVVDAGGLVPVGPANLGA